VALAELDRCTTLLAKRTIRRAARLLGDRQERIRYEAEWLAELESIPGIGMGKLIFPLDILRRVGAQRESLGVGDG